MKNELINKTSYYQKINSEELKLEIRDILNMGYSKFFGIAVANFYYRNSSTIKNGDILKNIKLISYILSSYGYSQEQIVKFISDRKYMILNSNFDLRQRIIIFFKFDLLDWVLFNNPYLLNESFKYTYCSNAQLLKLLENGNTIDEIITHKVKNPKVEPIKKETTIELDYSFSHFYSNIIKKIREMTYENEVNYIKEILASYNIDSEYINFMIIKTISYYRSCQLNNRISISLNLYTLLKTIGSNGYLNESIVTWLLDNFDLLTIDNSDLQKKMNLLDQKGLLIETIKNHKEIFTSKYSFEQLIAMFKYFEDKNINYNKLYDNDYTIGFIDSLVAIYNNKNNIERTRA